MLEWSVVAIAALFVASLILVDPVADRLSRARRCPTPGTRAWAFRLAGLLVVFAIAAGSFVALRRLPEELATSGLHGNDRAQDLEAARTALLAWVVGVVAGV